MLERPDIQDEKILTALRTEYSLRISQLDFLPLGADQHTAVYRATSENGRQYFVKLRGAVFDEITILLPKYLSDHGLRQIIAPLATQPGGLWVSLGEYTLSLYPFTPGYDGYESRLSESHWRELGQAFKRIHSIKLPAALQGRLRRENYSNRWRQMLGGVLERISRDDPRDPLSVELTATLQTQRDVIQDLIDRAERFAHDCARREMDFVLCHGDIHAGNVLVAPSGDLYIVDWDEPILAPKERDLMYIGASLLGNWYPPEQEQTLFYQGYGPVEIDAAALSYYRYERIVVDIALFSQSILEGKGSLEDRQQGLRYLKSNFEPNGTIELAYRWDQT